MQEIVLVRIAAYPLDAFKALHFRKHEFQKSRRVEQHKADRRARRKDNLVEFRYDAFARHDSDTLRVPLYRIECQGLNLEAQLGSEPHGPHHSQRVVRKGYVRIARGAYDIIPQVLHAVERVHQSSEILLAERPRQSVDGKIPAQLVVLQSPCADGRLARIAAVRLLSRTDELYLHSVGTEHRGSERLEHRHLRVQFASQSVGQLYTVAVHHHVHIAARTVQVIIPHVSANHESSYAQLRSQTRNALEYGQRQRFYHYLTYFSITFFQTSYPDIIRCSPSLVYSNLSLPSSPTRAE